ncbi:c-type cytochrome [Piscinibacter sakaiensis]|uniref:c-type cytochrome n=1 Tax=Piscinibacter sakaiensis TaxID=1547922 RepID=UPI00372B6710
MAPVPPCDRPTRPAACHAPALRLACGARPPASAPAPDDMAERMLACAACHGREGRSTPEGYHPRIAGKPSGYLFHQLQNFRERRRLNATMAHFVDRMDDAYLREIAGYFAALELPYAPPQPADATPQALALGRRVALEGDPARGVPACTACHGAAMTGVAPAIPGLLGLPRAYLGAQLSAWRQGRRRAHAPDCMAEVARRLSDEQLAAAARHEPAGPPPGRIPARAAPSRDRAGPPPDPGRRAGTGRAGSCRARRRAAARAAGPGARGAYLARAGNCGGCHSAPGGAEMAGGRGIDTPFGTVYAGNLTPDPETGLGGWSAEDFWRALHHGRSRDGRLLVPVFPYPEYTRVRRADADDLYAYLRSLPAVRQSAPAHTLRFPFDTPLALAAWRLLYFTPGEQADDPARDAAWNRGRYLVRGLGHCGACHTPRNALGGPRDADEFGGGPIPMQRWIAPSLASAAEAGRRLVRRRGGGAAADGPFGARHRDRPDGRGGLPLDPAPARRRPACDGPLPAHPGAGGRRGPAQRGDDRGPGGPPVRPPLRRLPR